MANIDFAAVAKPAFEFLTKDRGYSLVDEQAGGSFDNASLTYESARLRIRIYRERGQVFTEVRAKGDWRDWDEEILALLLAGVQHYSRSFSLPEYSIAGASRFLGDNLGPIEDLLDPSRLESTARLAEQLKNERAEVLFGSKEKN